MERLEEVDARYYWTESDGVIVVRPVDAWKNAKHFLHVTLDELELDDATLSEALDVILARLDPLRGKSPIAYDASPAITVSTGQLSLIEALDATVRSHGAARWAVSYCLPEMLPDIAMVRLFTADERGTGRRALQLRDTGGQWIDRCRPQ